MNSVATLIKVAPFLRCFIRVADKTAAAATAAAAATTTTTATCKTAMAAARNKRRENKKSGAKPAHISTTQLHNTHFPAIKKVSMRELVGWRGENFFSPTLLLS